MIQDRTIRVEKKADRNSNIGINKETIQYPTMKITLEKNINNYFKNLARNKMVIPGLLLGQSSKEKSYIIHAVRNQEYTEILNTENSQQNIDEYSSMLIDHALQVIRMLPGGTFIMGFFIISDNNIFADNYVNSIQSLGKKIKNHLKAEEEKYFNYILHYNFSNDEIKIKKLENLSKQKEINLEFKKISWLHIQSFLNFDDIPSLYFPQEMTLKLQTEMILKKVEKLLNESMFTFNGSFYDLSTSVKSLGIKGAYKGKNIVDVNIYQPCEFEENINKENLYQKSFVEKIICSGILGCNVYLNEDSTIDDAILAVKNDILRSLGSRIEMHLDSLLEGEVNFQEMRTVHEPPRRILINLPDSDVQLSDYLFPGESQSELSEALESLKELLDIDINSSTIDKDFEDPSQIMDETEPTVATPDVVSTEKQIEDSPAKSHFKIGLAIGLLVVLLAVLYQFILK